MANKKIKTEIKCENIAPIIGMNEVLNTGSLKIGVFANNGSGKTFLSRMFRLTENSESLNLLDDATSPTDKLITIGENKAEFNFKIENTSGEVVEDFKIQLARNGIPKLPDTYYTYHVFNEDYVEENLRAYDYDKDGNIDGYILGKTNIDLSEDEQKLIEIKKEENLLKEEVKKNIETYVSDKIDNISYIKKLKEYKLLETDTIFNQINRNQYDVTKSYSDLISDFNKVKSIPEHLEDINELKEPDLDISFLANMKIDCEEEFTLNSLAESLKLKIKNKQVFIETGISLLDKNLSNCPFCEQNLEESALKLIDSYSEYINDIESTTIKRFNDYIKTIKELNSKLNELETKTLRINTIFNKYKNDYIPSFSKIDLERMKIEELVESFNLINEKINEKLKNIAVKISFDDIDIDAINNKIKSLFDTCERNNKKIKSLNLKKKNISSESISIRKNICKRAANDLLNENKKTIQDINELRAEYEKLNNTILKKKESVKVSKKKRVIKTVKEVLNTFFGDKYTLDENTFRLSFKSNLLERKQAKDVLSAGEKNILAFAFYIGETHIKVTSNDDYKRLFFIIDDPISSMDFSHVYSVCGVIRDLKTILEKLEEERFIILTHNNEFMRILSSNNLIGAERLFSRGKFKKYSTTLTVPYVSHLQDLYRIARKEEAPIHTTANSIRHVIETLTKFENFNIKKPDIKEYIRLNFDNTKQTYTLIQDLSHGGWRSEQSPITSEDYIDICEDIILHVEAKYAGQIVYCKKTC